MDIKEIEKRVQVYNEAYKNLRELDIMGIHDDGLHVTNEFLIEASQETVNKYVFSNRDSSDYPYKVSLKINDIIFFAICDGEEFKNIFGGNVNESL